MLLIHAGLHKTGTKYLQTKIFPEMDIAYSPRINKQINELLYNGGVPTGLREWVDAQTKPVVISNEAIALKIKHRGFERYPFNRMILRQIFPEAKFLVVTRDGEDWAASLYNQYIRNYGTESFEDFRQSLELNWDLLEADYKLKYETLKKDPQKFVDELANILGVPSVRAPAEARNKKWPEWRIRIKRFFNRLRGPLRFLKFWKRL